MVALMEIDFRGRRDVGWRGGVGWWGRGGWEGANFRPYDDSLTACVTQHYL